MSSIPLTDEHLTLIELTLQPDVTYDKGYELQQGDVLELVREVQSWRRFAEHAFPSHCLPDICCPGIWTRKEVVK